MFKLPFWYYLRLDSATGKSAVASVPLLNGHTSYKNLRTVQERSFFLRIRSNEKCHPVNQNSPEISFVVYSYLQQVKIRIKLESIITF